MSSTPIKLVVGLGNPGEKYNETRHNAGFLFLNELCRTYSVKLQFNKHCFGRLAQFSENGSIVRLLAPDTFMNLSGKAVVACMNFYKITINEVLVAHDELDHEPGSARLKFSGGHGGHNGLRDIIAQSGSNDFLRLRLGIGHPGSVNAVSGYVLKQATKLQQEQINAAIVESSRVLPMILTGDLHLAMNELHTAT